MRESGGRARSQAPSTKELPILQLHLLPKHLFLSPRSHQIISMRIYHRSNEDVLIIADSSA
jgi:hypothetical protein